MPDLIQQLRQSLAPYFLSYDGTRLLGRGTAFPATGDIPGGLQANDRFFRTDLGWLCYYDGARWLTVHEYAQPLTDYRRATIPFTGASGVLQIGPVRTDGTNLAITRVAAYLDVLTTNNGANFWTLAFKTSAGTTIQGFSTAADGPGAAILKEFAINVPYADPTYVTLEVTLRTGAPGSLVAHGVVWYRIEPP
jgi:hypothetical protein